MRIQMNQKVQITETISMHYVGNDHNRFIVNICMASDCGCSLEACRTEYIEPYDTWSVDLGDYSLILYNIISYTDGTFSFAYYIE